MAIHIIREDGTAVDVTDNEVTRQLVEELYPKVEPPEDEDLPETTETVTFTLKRSGWHWVSTVRNSDGSTTITLGR